MQPPSQRPDSRGGICAPHVTVIQQVISSARHVFQHLLGVSTIRIMESGGGPALAPPLKYYDVERSIRRPSPAQPLQPQAGLRLSA